MLRSISLYVNPGEIVCLLGSNGAGKSTTLRTIIGLIKPDEGNIYFEGQKINIYKTYQIIRLGISLVPEGRRLFPKMSVIENLNIAIKDPNAADKNQELRERIFELFPVLMDRKTQLAGTLSGGEQAMLSIGRALMQEPKLLILDEPSFGLAPILVEEFYNTIQIINKQGTTILLSEQNAGKALSLADRGYVLQKGAILIEGKTQDLLKSEEVKKAYLGE
ncbi:MAG: ABC transporter ATP-binding protein [Spirochaetes bacterium]|nr:MAG: ABC transporter ATP-binding protein [Spirochaetota bacterium]